MKIELTETEIFHIMDALGNRIDDLQDCAMFGDAIEIEDEIAELTELLDDLREASARRDDGWGEPSQPDAAAEFIQAGIDAREQVKGDPEPAQSREQQVVERMMKGTVTPCDPDFMNDPRDW